jgi:hypothetical protein
VNDCSVDFVLQEYSSQLIIVLTLLFNQIEQELINSQSFMEIYYLKKNSPKAVSFLHSVLTTFYL